MYYLLILFILVLFYKFYSLKEGFYHSVNQCFDTNTPYIKFGDMHICFDTKNKVEDTINVFYGKEKNCFIDPKNTTMSFYDMNGNLIDLVTEKGVKVCKPYKVNIG